MYLIPITYKMNYFLFSTTGEKTNIFNVKNNSLMMCEKYKFGITEIS